MVTVSEGLPDPRVTAAVSAAAELCRARGLQFTELRRRLLAALWAASHPMGAYELLHHLETTWGRPLVPTTVYRALDFLRDLNLIARIESRNAYVPRIHQGHPHACVFFVCERCSAALEIEDAAIESALQQGAQTLGFEIHRTALELKGLCEHCQTASVHSHTAASGSGSAGAQS